MSDTGDSIIEIPPAYHARFPYGQTIKNATGRPSAGLQIIDYIAQSAGLPFLQPYENPNPTFKNGIEFAVAGVSALSVETPAKCHIPPRITNSSLNVQLEWLDKYVQTKCNGSKDCQRHLMKSALLMVGEIGANDYDAGLLLNMTIDEVKKVMVPVVVQAIRDAAKFESEQRPQRLVFYEHHNVLLQWALEQLRKEYPDVHIAYADLYHAHEWILQNHSKLGFKSLTVTCCGRGGKYNFMPGLLKACGAPGVPVLCRRGRVALHS
ncbi:carboxylic ester hydrolase, putative [Ricinus communis]|uniref:Carboxylic ester hydrolase, putative n=1 Tax=Ricinus communis TaxID=3988 RepID=B9RFC6_RICCO|nr:carboxylic ester hydrolase, putative [Ricinus communis]